MKFLIRILMSFAAFLAFLNTSLSSEGGFFNPVVSTPVVHEGLHDTNNPAVVDAYTTIFSDNVYHLSQQRGSVCMPFVLMEGMVSAQKRIERITALPDPQMYQVRFSSVQATNPDNDNRWITAQRYYHACFVDNYDQIRTLWDMKNAYTQAIAMSFGRLYDRIIFAALLGSAQAGANKEQLVPLPYSQKVAAFDDTDTSAPTDGRGLNLRTLRAVRLKQKSNFAIQANEMLVWVVTANEIDDLLAETKITNRDFTTILTLMEGEVRAFLGMVFIQSELLPHNDSTVHFNYKTGDVSASAPGANAATIAANKAVRTICFVAQKSACFGINVNLFGRMSQMPQNHYNWMIYYAGEFGAVRKEEVTVAEIFTHDKRVA